MSLGVIDRIWKDVAGYVDRGQTESESGTGRRIVQNERLVVVVAEGARAGSYGYGTLATCMRIPNVRQLLVKSRALFAFLNWEIPF